MASRIKCRLSVLGVFLFLPAMLARPAWADMYSGSLTVANGGLVASDGWNNSGTSIAWTVTVGASNVHYSYVFRVAAKYPSHLILGVTEDPAFDPTNTRDFRNFEIDPDIGPIEVPTRYLRGGSNPYMPDGGVFGIKFNAVDGENGESDVWTIDFDSDRLPMWGDFYVKDGKGPIPGEEGSEWATAWNSGFGTMVTDPYSQPVAGKLLVPDGAFVPVPGAVLLGMLGLGYAGIRLRKMA